MPPRSGARCTVIIAVDPGAKSLAVAWGDETLEECFLLRARRKDIFHSELVIGTHVPHCREARLFVAEVPQVYQAGKGKGNPNTLIDLTASACLYGGAFACPVKLLRPRQWKGQVPKEAHNRRTLKKLTHAELKVLDAAEVIDIETGKCKRCPDGLRHNLLDAIGLYLREAGR